MGEEVPRLRQRKVYGWVLRLTGWAMRGAGTAGVITGTLGMRMSGSASSSLFGYRAPTWPERFFIFFMVMIAGVVIFFVRLPMARYARRHLAQVIRPASLKPGSYVRPRKQRSSGHVRSRSRRRLDQLRTALAGASPDVEGVLIELDNSAGQPLLLSGVAYRTGEGGLWFAPGQDDRFGAIHGGTPAG